MSDSEKMYPELNRYLKGVQASFTEIDEKRRALLQVMASYVVSKGAVDVHLVFICTHNSRRSQMAQIWAWIASYSYGIAHVHSHSGGTEVTAFNSRSVNALRRAGISITGDEGNNPKYEVRFGAQQLPLIAYSKKYEEATVKAKPFAAVMTCSEADVACPVIPAAEVRFPLRYEDPKEADDTLDESKRYDERCFQIAREMCYLMQEVASGVRESKNIST